MSSHANRMFQDWLADSAMTPESRRRIEEEDERFRKLALAHARKEARNAERRKAKQEAKTRGKRGEGKQAKQPASRGAASLRVRLQRAFQARRSPNAEHKHRSGLASRLRATSTSAPSGRFPRLPRRITSSANAMRAALLAEQRRRKRLTVFHKRIAKWLRAKRKMGALLWSTHKILPDQPLPYYYASTLANIGLDDQEESEKRARLSTQGGEDLVLVPMGLQMELARKAAGPMIKWFDQCAKRVKDRLDRHYDSKEHSEHKDIRYDADEYCKRDFSCLNEAVLGRAPARAVRQFTFNGYQDIWNAFRLNRLTAREQDLLKAFDAFPPLPKGALLFQGQGKDAHEEDVMLRLRKHRNFESMVGETIDWTWPNSTSWHPNVAIDFTGSGYEGRRDHGLVLVLRMAERGIRGIPVDLVAASNTHFGELEVLLQPGLRLVVTRVVEHRNVERVALMKPGASMVPIARLRVVYCNVFKLPAT